MAFLNIFDRQNLQNDFPYYRQVWLRVMLALLAAALLPMIVVGGGVATYAFRKIEANTQDNLRLQVQMHQQAIDRFLVERENHLKMIAALYPLEDLITPGRLTFILYKLQQQVPGFVDLGIIDRQGRHLAYTGSEVLLSKTYDQQDWFNRIAQQDSYISDIYLGHRQIPHFIMAVRRGSGEQAFVLRATVDSDIFDALVTGGPGELKTNTFIVNQAGLYQTRSQSGGGLMAPSGIRPDADIRGIHTIASGNVLNLMLWQEKAPWLNVVQVKQADIYGPIERARLAVIITFIVGALLIVATAALTTGHLVTRLENKRQNLHQLDKHLRRTSHLAATMELSLGFFEELRDIISNIDIAVQTLAAPELNSSFTEGKEALCQIAREASRGHKLLDRVTALVRPEDPIVTNVNINDLLDDLLTLLNNNLQHRSITIMRDYQIPPASLRSDRGKLRQVFQHLILNAITAVDKDGTIRLITQTKGNHVIVTIGDTGAGIAAQDRDRIFEPLYSTKPEGIGLGLSICRSILDQLGGTLTLDSRTGQETVFSVRIPGRITL